MVSTTGRHRVWTFMACLDRGPDNVGWAGRMMTLTKHSPYVVFWTTWCMLHGSHLCAKNVLQTFDSWNWASLEGDEFWSGCCYFSATATVLNTSLSPSIHQRLQRAVVGIVPEDRAGSCFRRIPGRALRGRWASIDTAEDVILHEAMHLGPCFTEAL